MGIGAVSGGNVVTNCPQVCVFAYGDHGMELVLDTADSVDHACLQIPALSVH